MLKINNNIETMIKSNEVNKKNELAALKKNAQALIEMAANIESGEASSDMLAMLVNTLGNIASRIQTADARIETCRQMQGMSA